MTSTYKCRRCGNCCRWAGYVRLSDADIDGMAALLEMDPYAFLAEYTILTLDRQDISLIEKADGSCIFLDGKNICRVNAAKPQQCRGFPNAWNFVGFDLECEAERVPAADTPS